MMFDGEVAAQISGKCTERAPGGQYRENDESRHEHRDRLVFFQVEAIRAVHFYSKNTLLVQMTGNGKSAVPAGALIMSG